MKMVDLTKFEKKNIKKEYRTQVSDICDKLILLKKEVALLNHSFNERGLNFESQQKIWNKLYKERENI